MVDDQKEHRLHRLGAASAARLTGTLTGGPTAGGSFTGGVCVYALARVIFAQAAGWTRANAARILARTATRSLVK